MVDREKVVEGLEMSYKYSNVDENNTLVPQWIVLHALALLKAQEPVFERQFMSSIEIYDCGKCGTSLGAKGIAKYCMNCGQAVKWE